VNSEWLVATKQRFVYESEVMKWTAAEAEWWWWWWWWGWWWGGDIAGFSLERHRQSIQRFLDIGIHFSRRHSGGHSCRVAFHRPQREKINRIGLWIPLTRAALIRFAWNLGDWDDKMVSLLGGGLLGNPLGGKARRRVADYPTSDCMNDLHASPYQWS